MLSLSTDFVLKASTTGKANIRSPNEGPKPSLAHDLLVIITSGDRNRLTGIMR